MRIPPVNVLKTIAHSPTANLEKNAPFANPDLTNASTTTCISRLTPSFTASTGEDMPDKKANATQGAITREKLTDLLNEDLAREFQAIIAYVNYSQVLKGAAYMNIAAELAVHATEELAHAIILANQIDYLGGMPTTVPKPVKTSEKAEEMLRFDLDNENDTIRNYRRRIKQCDELGEFATAEQIRQILIQEQDHQISLATALGIDVPNVGIAD
jgi:bacterioferritin